MTLPPGVGRRDFSAALRAFASAVGTEWVFSDAEDVTLYLHTLRLQDHRTWGGVGAFL